GEETLKKAPQHPVLLAATAELLRLANKQDLATDYELRLGEALVQAGRDDDALQTLYTLFRTGVSSPRLLELIARAHVHKGEFQAALDLLSQALRRDPTSSDLLKTKAIVLVGCGQYQEAIEIHHKLLLRDPSTVKDIVGLADALVDQERLDEAAAALN